MNKPVFTPNKAEITHGIFKDGVYHRPKFAILKNGQYLEIDGVIQGYWYDTARQIVKNLQAIASDEFMLTPCQYVAITMGGKA